MLKKIIFLLCAGALVLFLAGNSLLPKQYWEKIPYRFYHVMTNSMEPRIKTNSLVCVKAYHKNQKLKEGDILTFYAERFGEKIIITHRLAYIEMKDNGEVVYRTHPEESDTLDVYETTEDDILGTYAFHIPFVGKWILFLKSMFGVVWMCEMVLIQLIQKLIAVRWEEKRLALATSE